MEAGNLDHLGARVKPPLRLRKSRCANTIARFFFKPVLPMHGAAAVELTQWS